MKSPNTEALDALAIYDIRLRGESVSLRNDFLPPESPYEEMIQQFAINPISYTFAELGKTLHNSDETETMQTVHFLTSCGVRYLEKTDETKDEITKNKERLEALTLSDFRCSFTAIFSSNKPLDELSEECLKRFHHENAVFNIWPFWRQWARCKTADYGLPPFVASLYTIPRR